MTCILLGYSYTSDYCGPVWCWMTHQQAIKFLQAKLEKWATMATSASDIILAIDRLTALRSRIAQFEKDGEILPGAAEIVRTEITQAIQVLIPF